jgi:hypothetical protein
LSRSLQLPFCSTCPPSSELPGTLYLHVVGT